MKSHSAYEPSRRTFLKQTTAALLLGATPAHQLIAAERRFRSDPFLLGVASGSPTPSSVVLWTRLITSLAEPRKDLGDDVIPVAWEIASDDRMRKIVRHGTELAAPNFAHSIHAEAMGLQPARDYWYRFTVGGVQSPIGRTRTAPALGDKLKRLRFALASCQKYENGYYVAYRHMLKDELDLIIHCGDYIYEGTGGNDLVRGDGSSEALTLDQYRARYALYKSDADLRAAHAAHPWLVTWDDHEVVNDYAGSTSYDQSGAEFLARRAGAYRAYYEHMPLPLSAMPTGPDMQLYAHSNYGDLVQIHMLDSRQYRSPLACLGPGDDEGPGAKCAELFDATRTKLGRQQEAWLRANLATSHARWNVMVQGTPMAHVDLDPGPGVAYRRDSWDGYPAARQRFLDAIVETKAINPVVVDGDLHAFQIANLNKQANDIATPVVASEFTTTSITSPGIRQKNLDARRQDNPNVLLSDSTKHGYLLMDFTAERLRTDLVTVDTIKQPESARGVMASYIVENGRPGPMKA